MVLVLVLRIVSRIQAALGGTGGSRRPCTEYMRERESQKCGQNASPLH